MKLIFKKTYEELKTKLSDLDGEWDISQSGKKVFRSLGGVMSWHENTGTIQFQGTEEGKKYLEQKVKYVLYQDDSMNAENQTSILNNVEKTDSLDKKIWHC